MHLIDFIVVFVDYIEYLSMFVLAITPNRLTMKTKLLLLLSGMALFISCSNEPYELNDSGNLIIDVPGQVDDGITTGEENLYEDDLIAGQNMDAGTVVVTIVNGEIVVTYVGEGWEITETHLYIGPEEEMPSTNNGNPKVGNFPYKNNHPAGTTEVTYTGPSLLEGDCVYIAAHAVVVNTTTGQTETAWAAGIPMGGNNWAMGFEVCL